ncbi:hypothetical protein FB45DRAFT_1110058 [Roridomyces roridus]|uniref:Uncharacterized protein n=1 Tax=Roridomyces roridus TaxID=1738132 RepID=A0AAD7B900_9AGAR|nr:hypothetical protein FB45DRAFT_1110058 [Roridomyces roridus]
MPGNIGAVSFSWSMLWSGLCGESLPVTRSAPSPRDGEADSAEIAYSELAILTPESAPRTWEASLSIRPLVTPRQRPLSVPPSGTLAARLSSVSTPDKDVSASEPSTQSRTMLLPARNLREIKINGNATKTRRPSRVGTEPRKTNTGRYWIPYSSVAEKGFCGREMAGLPPKSRDQCRCCGTDLVSEWKSRLHPALISSIRNYTRAITKPDLWSYADPAIPLMQAKVTDRGTDVRFFFRVGRRDYDATLCFHALRSG